MSNPVVLKKNLPSGTIILNRPETLNALSREMVSALQVAFEDFHGERSVRAVILTAAGPSFCSGTDIKQLAETGSQEDALTTWQDDVEQFQQLLETMLRFPKPILVAANGWVVGSGLSLLLAGDYVIAGDNCRFWLPESIRGLSGGLTIPLLAFRAGAALANRFLYHPEPISAQQVSNFGVVHEVVSTDLIWVRAQQIAADIAKGSAQSNLLAKQLLNQTVGEDLLVQLSIGAAQTATARTTDVAKEGIQAFLERRAPKF